MYLTTLICSLILDHIKRVCPHFDLLERLYGHLVESNTSATLAATSSDLDEYMDEMITNDVLSSDLDSTSNANLHNEMPIENVQIKCEIPEPPIHSELHEVDHIGSHAAPVEYYTANHAPLEYTPEPSTASNSETDFKANHGLVDRPRKRPATDTSSVDQLVALQEKKLKFEIMKLQQQLDLERQKLDLEREKLCLAREQNHVDMEMKRLQLQQETELKRLTIERDERVALAKIRLEVESLERIKKYEIGLKANKD